MFETLRMIEEIDDVGERITKGILWEDNNPQIYISSLNFFPSSGVLPLATYCQLHLDIA